MTKTASPLKPPLTLLALTIFAHLPLGLPAEADFIFPSLVMALIFIWSLNSVGKLPPWFIFTLGLIADVFSSGPIGYWSLYYLSAQGLAFWFARNSMNSGMLTSWIGFVFTSLVTTFLAWTIATLYFGNSAEYQSMIIGVVTITIAYPLLYWATGLPHQKASATEMKN